ncbi:MAG: hypothetical protein F6K22_06285 [Okeania sp. SIO2F4]|uniref:hypothetical protein n=1 Tax=Okeania sp. SIO2F4 TaxID=2607790 RepID=UPI00142CEA05|nr:hypothetical protein [Okeania sp. SIO2F4]NES02480.1 hypothetical protein [Okeania sp. SIO2F4]
MLAIIINKGKSNQDISSNNLDKVSMNSDFKNQLCWKYFDYPSSQPILVCHNSGLIKTSSNRATTLSL